MVAFGNGTKKRVEVLTRLVSRDSNISKYESTNVSRLVRGAIGQIEGNPVHTVGTTKIVVHDPRLVPQVDRIIAPYKKLIRLESTSGEQPDVEVKSDKIFITNHSSFDLSVRNLSQNLLSLCSMVHLTKCRRRLLAPSTSRDLSAYSENGFVRFQANMPFAGFVWLLQIHPENRVSLLFKERVLLDRNPFPKDLVLERQRDSKQQLYALICSIDARPLSHFLSEVPTMPVIEDFTERQSGQRLDSTLYGPGLIGSRAAQQVDHIDMLPPDSWFVSTTWL
jgi:hypothetical protein